MSAARGIIAGSLALAALEAAVSNPQSAANTGALFTLAASFVRRLMDPSVPLIPDRRK